MAANVIRVQSICGRESPAAEDVAVIDQAWVFSPGSSSSDIAAIGAFTDADGFLGTPVTGDFAALADAYEDFLAALAGEMYNGNIWQEIKINDATSGHPVPNAPVYTRAVSIAGTQSSQAAPQVAASVTLQVARRRSWGRYYVPGINAGSYTAAGRLTDGVVDALEASYVALAGAAAGNDWFPVVLTSGSPSPGTGHTVNAVRVDDVADVIRRRRFDAALYRAQDTIPP